MWLHIGLMDWGGAIGAFDHDLSLAQTSLDITHLQRRPLADILRLSRRCSSHLREDSVLSSSCWGLSVRASQGRIWPHGSFGIDDCREQIVIDLHSVGSILCESLRFADYDSHRMPAPPYFLLGQWRE